MILPPTVAILRNCAEAPAFSAIANNGYFVLMMSWSAAVLFATSAPMVNPFESAWIFLNGSALISISRCGAVTPFFIRSTRLVPPAINCEEIIFVLASTAPFTEAALVYSKFIIPLSLLFLLQRWHQQYLGRLHTGIYCRS